MIQEGCLQVDISDRWVLDELLLESGMKIEIQLAGTWITGRLEEQGRDLSFCSEQEPAPIKLFAGLRVRLV